MRYSWLHPRIHWKFWKAFCKRELIPDLLFEGSDNAKKHMEAIRFNDQIEDVPLNIFGTCQTTLLCLGRAPLKNATISLNCRDMLPEPTQSITPYQSCLPKCFRTRYPCVNLRARRSLRFSFFIRSMSLMLERFSENLAGLVSSTSSGVRTDSAQCLQMVPVSMRSSCETSATFSAKAKTVSCSIELHTLSCPTL